MRIENGTNKELKKIGMNETVMWKINSDRKASAEIVQHYLDMAGGCAWPHAVNRLITFLSLCVLAIPMVGPAEDIENQLSENFSNYKKGSDGSPDWEPTTVGWEMVDRTFIGNSGVARWTKAPFGRVVRFSCDLTVLEQLKGDWLTAGIGLYASERDYWALNLVAAPEKVGRKRTTELNEMFDARWLANHQGETRLPQLDSKGHQLRWEIGKTYRMVMSLNEQRISGRILHAGNELAAFAFKLDDDVKAVRFGKPGLRVNGMRVRYDNVQLHVDRRVEPPKKERSIPPWQSRPGKPITEGAGYFRTVQQDGRWWTVDPEGKPFFIVGTDHANYRVHWCEKLGYAPYNRNVEAKYGSEEKWAESTMARLKNWGFNTLAANHSRSLRHRGLPYIQFARMGSSFAGLEWIAERTTWTGFPDVFSPRWERHCRLIARRLAKESAGDPWCIGTFIDNELEWFGKKGHLIDDIFRLGPDSAAKNAFFEWLKEQHGNIAGINKALGLRFTDRAGFLKSKIVPPVSPALESARKDFLSVIAERYFGIAAAALRTAAPEHLVLGCRFAGWAPEAALTAAGKHSDVFTFNTYPRIDMEDASRPDTDGVVRGVARQLTDYYADVRKPVIITEWSFPALDSGLPCKHGAGMRVDTQQQKAACYRIFANAMADLPFMVGYHYFMWVDEPALGISSTFPEDSNYGLVNERDEPYQVLVQTASVVNRGVQARHSRSIVSGTLKLLKSKNGVKVINPGDIPARGILKLRGAGQSRTDELALAPGASKRFATKGTSWMAQLTQWDGTQTRVVGGRGEGLSVTNFSTSTLQGMPVVLDSRSPETGKLSTAATWLEAIAPGETVKLKMPDARLRAVDRFDLKSGEVTWSCHRKDGSLFDHVKAGDLSLGRFLFAIHQRTGETDQWVSTDKVIDLRILEHSDAWIVDAIVERSGSGTATTQVDAAGKMKSAPTGPARFRAAVRAVVFKRDGIAVVRPLWVESLDPRPWQFVEAFWFNRPAIAASPDNDIPGRPDVPNYYLTAQFWTDSKLGGLFGAAAISPEWRVHFWKDGGGGFHPDSYYRVEQPMQKGTRWSGKNVPYHWVYASSNMDDWRRIALAARQYQSFLIPGQ